ncbi:hypothetical protein GQ53DRAFT_190591 [Thozetella sp. PMI_491]|nr:hypothetical protein GQ53DRAFT_190591 [Thozetella sp. PMI_491]
MSAAPHAQLGNGSSAFAPGAPPSASASAPVAGSDAGSGAGEVAANPRKRKKASRACDFCHVNHQPCDNGQPRCSVCEKHDKPCLYLRPTKRRGPQKGYRTALNTYKESAAAWGAVLNSIPGLDALIEGHLRSEKAGQLLKAIRDPGQQDGLIAAWQQSSVFKAFFGQEASATAALAKCEPAMSLDAEEEDEEEEPRTTPAIPHKRRTSQLTSQVSPVTYPSYAPAKTSAPDIPNPLISTTSPNPGPGPGRRESTTLSDLVARDAARASASASQTLSHLGFAPGETMFDFYDMGSNPEPISQPTSTDFDPTLGTESEQRIFYELLMGRAFP